MITHKYLIEQGFHFRKYEYSDENTFGGTYHKHILIKDKFYIYIYLDKFTDEFDDFSDCLLHITCGSEELKYRFMERTLSIEVFNMLINLVN